MENKSEEIKKLYLQDSMSTRQIGRQKGLSQWTVIRNLRKLGVPIRTQKEGRNLKSRFGENHWHWKGGRIGASDGGRYVYVYAPDHPHATKNRYVMEHRLMMEEKLGRFLKSTEIVHHINGDTKDNRPENLEVISRSMHVHNHFAKGKYVMQLEERIRQLETEVKDLKIKVS